MTTISGIVGTANPQSARMIVDMAKTIAMLDPEAGPLVVIVKNLASLETTNTTFDSLEDDLRPRWAYVNLAYTAAGLTLTVDDAYKGYVGALVKHVSTGAIFYISAIASATTWTIVEDYGATATPNMAVNDALYIMSNVNPQGGTYRSGFTTQETKQSNYTQIFQTAMDFARSTMMTAWYGGDYVASERRKAGIDHLVRIEGQFIFGELKDTTLLDADSAAKKARATQGALSFITTNVDTIASGILTEKDVVAHYSKVLNYDSNSQRMSFCGSKALEAFSGFARDKIRLIPRDRTYGIQVAEWIHPWGAQVLLKRHRQLENSTVGDTTQGYAGYMITLNMKNIKYRYLSGSDTKLLVDVRSNFDGQRDLYLTECGFQLNLEKTHGVLKGITDYAT